MSDKASNEYERKHSLRDALSKLPILTKFYKRKGKNSRK